MKAHNLTDFFEQKNIKKNGTFEAVGSAKSKVGNNVICYASTLEYVLIANKNPNISCIITTESYYSHVTNKAVVIDEEPEVIYGKLVSRLTSEGKLAPPMSYSIDPTAVIHSTAIVSKKCKIGKNVIIGRYAIIEDYSILDDNVIIGDFAVIGCDGFYFKRDKNNKLNKMLHLGGVHLHKNVEIMTRSMVQRAHDSNFTIVNEGTKISVNVNVGHSAVIGKHNMITGNVQIAGRVNIGNNCWIGTSSTISDSVSIGDNSSIKIGSVVVKDVGPNEVVSGSFAIPHNKNLKQFVRAFK